MRIILFFLLVASFAFAEKAPQADKIMNHVFYHLNDTGTIYQDRFGYVYLKVDDKFITDLHDFIKDEGFEDPGHAYGAHITVIYGNEINKWIAEDGSTATFTVSGCEIVPSNKNGIESYCVLKVTSSDLAKLRKKYNLGHLPVSFHITIGKKIAAEEKQGSGEEAA